LLPSSAHVSSAVAPVNNVVNNTGGKVFENVRDIQAEFVIRQYEEMERYWFKGLKTWAVVMNGLQDEVREAVV
jgi:hypothetical protein